MEIKKTASAGTLESSDCLVTVSPCPSGREINVESIVMTTFGEAIRNELDEILTQYGVENAAVDILDKGAIDCVIRARTVTALFRAAEEKFDWGRL